MGGNLFSIEKNRCKMSHCLKLQMDSSCRLKLCVVSSCSPVCDQFWIALPTTRHKQLLRYFFLIRKHCRKVPQFIGKFGCLSYFMCLKHSHHNSVLLLVNGFTRFTKNPLLALFVVFINSFLLFYRADHDTLNKILLNKWIDTQNWCSRYQNCRILDGLSDILNICLSSHRTHLISCQDITQKQLQWSL